MVIMIYTQAIMSVKNVVTNVINVLHPKINVQSVNHLIKILV